MPDALYSFRHAILASPELQSRLGAIEMPEVFEREAVAAAAELGIALPAQDVFAQRSPLMLDRWPDTGWLPVRSVPGATATEFDWAWFGDRPLTESFYGDSVRRMATRPLSRMLRPRTGLDALIAGAAQAEALAPQGFIFHMSRCGSTLAAQMLAAVPHHIVVSEAEPIDAVVQWAGRPDVPREVQIAALRAIVAALGRDRGGSAQRYFVKLDSWHVLALPLFRAAFPDVPWVFLYREPVEVLVSQSRNPGLHFAAGDLGVVPDEAFSLEAHGAKVLAGFLLAAAEHAALGDGMLVDYADLARAMASDVPEHFGFVPDAADRAAMSAAALRDAKAPGETFAADGEAKRAAATPAIMAAADAYLREPHARLEALRLLSQARVSDST